MRGQAPVAGAPGTVWIDFTAPTESGGAVRGRFADSVQVLQAHEPGQVREVLDAVQAQALAGRWCVGFVAYEAAAAFDPALAVHPSAGPLAWFGVYEQRQPWPLEAPLADGHEAAHAAHAAHTAHVTWGHGPERAQFDADLSAIQQAIAAGEFYQINHTAQWQGQWRQGTPLALFAALRRAQPGGYAAYIDTGAQQLLSVSPELFFDWEGTRLLARPMKGTAPRGGSPEQDAAQAERLRTSAKERAENVMIVDLIRNDLSRVAQPFSVQVPRLFHPEALPTVWQMTSDVTAKSRPGTTLAQVFAALFPCGSVTGAPKVQAMRMIRALEPGPRGVYCGAIGVVRPGGHATFNVPIRTVTVRGGALQCGIGSGITSGATPDGEWQEWSHKRAFLERASEPFALLETLALAQGQLRYVDDHVARLHRAAQHFAYPWAEGTVQAALQTLTQQHPEGVWRVRLLLDAAGHVQVQAYAMESSPAEVVLQLAAQPFEGAQSEFVRYKTTRRAHYDAAAPSVPGVFDTLLWNEQGELTECTRGNIAVQLEGQWLTPPLSSGLLNGVGRAVALRQGRLREAVVRVGDLPRATGLAFVNSLRGWIPARLAS